MPTMSAMLTCFLGEQGSGFNFGAASTPSTPAFGASNPIFGAANAGNLCSMHLASLISSLLIRPASCKTCSWSTLWFQQDKAKVGARRHCLGASARQPLEPVQPRRLPLGPPAAQHSALGEPVPQPLGQGARQHLGAPARARPASLAAPPALELPTRQPSALQVSQDIQPAQHANLTRTQSPQTTVPSSLAVTNPHPH